MMDCQGGEVERVDKGQASPRGVLSIEVRVGQMGARPSMRRVQRVGRRMMGMEDAWVVGWERR